MRSAVKEFAHLMLTKTYVKNLTSILNEPFLRKCIDFEKDIEWRQLNEIIMVISQNLKQDIK